MKHSALNRGVMRDWIAVAIETGAAMPTDGEIMDRFGFTNPETARTLLADLADRGDISIRWEGEERIITLGRTKPAMMEGAARPVPSIVKKDPGLDEAVDKIKSILGRGRQPVRVEAAHTYRPAAGSDAVAAGGRADPTARCAAGHCRCTTCGAGREAGEGRRAQGGHRQHSGRGVRGAVPSSGGWWHDAGNARRPDRHRRDARPGQAARSCRRLSSSPDRRRLGP